MAYETPGHKPFAYSQLNELTGTATEVLHPCSACAVKDSQKRSSFPSRTVL